MLKFTLLLSFLAMGGLGCAVQAAASGPLSIERANECKTHCDTLAMDLGAVVVIMNSAGCVCEPRGKYTSNGANVGGAATTAGGAAIHAAIEAQQQSQRQRAAQQ